MGQEIVCIGRLRNQVSEGKAYLESDHVRFRGAFRVKVPFRDLTGVEVEDGWLVLHHPEGDLGLQLGSKSADWERRIRNPKPLVDKLGVKPGARISVLGVDDASFHEALRERAGEIFDGTPAPGSDLIFVQIMEPAALGAIAQLVPFLKPDGGIWVVSPKGRKELREVEIITAAREAGLVDVKVSSFSNGLTALKFMIPVPNRKK